MPLPARAPKKAKRDSRWRSQKHRDFVRQHACANCGSFVNREFAHVRIGSGAGMGQKPDDWHGVSLCAECHRTGDQAQHTMGEQSFWDAYAKREGESVSDLIRCFILASPVRREIETAQRERGHGA